MKIVTLEKFVEKSLEFSTLNLINECFSENRPCLGDESELAMRVIAMDHENVISHAAMYIRSMRIDDYTFKGSIIGDVVVSRNYRGRGLCKIMLDVLNSFNFELKIEHSFLFAYEPKIYLSCGYRNLTNEIKFFDSNCNEWKKFVYKGGLHKQIGNSKLPDGVIDFCGKVY
ncbi:GNAT family N-acetyltransferase [Vibrio rhizosphaerae]|uniref:GNAT family N-acetyltransferase n=1 Tax=Vibrio rhizosphaerae TaxID=398736 RepID=UPI00068CCE70|nr:GNAT family N-acetyltransferase [Vibrio rhizosphaerae]